MELEKHANIYIKKNKNPRIRSTLAVCQRRNTKFHKFHFFEPFRLSTQYIFFTIYLVSYQWL